MRVSELMEWLKTQPADGTVGLLYDGLGVFDLHLDTVTYDHKQNVFSCTGSESEWDESIWMEQVGLVVHQKGKKRGKKQG
jgi:hypothetical protein